MTVTFFGNATGAATPQPGLHPNTGEFHYTFNGVTSDSGSNSYPTLTGSTTRWGPFYEYESFHPGYAAQGDDQLTGSITGKNALTGAAITISAWVWIAENGVANVPICGVREPGSSGSPDDFNFPWELGVDTSGQARFFWQNGAKANQGLTGSANTAIPKEEWVHVIGTRNVAGTQCEIYLNGSLAESASGQLAWNGGSSQDTLYIGGQSAGDLRGYIASVYCELAYKDASGALDLYNLAKSVR